MKLDTYWWDSIKTSGWYRKSRVTFN